MENEINKEEPKYKVPEQYRCLARAYGSHIYDFFPTPTCFVAVCKYCLKRTEVLDSHE